MEYKKKYSNKVTHYVYIVAHLKATRSTITITLQTDQNQIVGTW